MTQTPSLLFPGPWIHRTVSAGGASFHVALAGEGERTVIFLHDFPLYWWSWREQLPAISKAGYRAIALDLRGFGASDLQPGEVDLHRLATDVTSVIRATGSETYTVVGAGMGGTIGWLLAHNPPYGMKSLVPISAPHPLTRFRPLTTRQTGTAPIDRLVRLPGAQKRALQEGKLVRDLLLGWSAEASAHKMKELVPVYSEPMERSFAAHAAWETYQATQHISLSDRHLFEPPITIPVCSIRGQADPYIPNSAYANDSASAGTEIVQLTIQNCGRYVSEEAPFALNQLLVEHLELTDK